MRRLLPFVCVVIVVDTMLYAALTPLLPHFRREFDLSKGGVGVLAAGFAIGVLLAAVPGGIVTSRFGARVAVIGGLTLVTLASVGVAFADSLASSSARGSSRASAPRSPGRARSPGSRSRPRASGAGGRWGRRSARPCSARCSGP